MTDLYQLASRLDEQLADADRALETQYPGDRGTRQPVHTVYIPGDRYAASTVPDWGRQALAALAEHGGGAASVAEELGLDPQTTADVYDRVVAKLADEPIEDLRIDFEDGFGDRGEAQEDAAVIAAAQALVRSIADRTAAPFHGIRFKSFEAPTRHRGLRTLDLFVGELARAGAMTPRFVVTLPKVTSVDQVSAMAVACDALEEMHRIAPGALKFEIQVETPQAILGPDGTALIARMIHAARGRCTGLHYGTYDYSASCGISAEFQSMEHPAADHAKAVMQVAAAGTGVFLSDGSTNVMPIGTHDNVIRAWKLHHRLVRRSLERGYYQGWDLHPAQLPSRFLATYAFYREGLPTAARRLHAYIHGGDSGYLDEPATATALASFVLRGVECGAVQVSEVNQLIEVDQRRLAGLARRKIG
ncbi:DUF6986 family protein [Leekyejoonella antrihumi]|uniref:Aldolase n=1 Tax=Leekyejoonella antrihumi TaxID=1660198 RepID=A0A563DZM9_9MICO|nr:aldolase/citrate lyase family protein [Leekyejoonella antrihumi]TWP35451.1 aldolase [Leekyejoonella antrihumi]